MRRLLAVLSMVSALTGCATTQLHFTTNRQISVIDDIYIEQTLENLARTASDPASLPYFSLLDSGVPAVKDRASLAGYLNFPAQTLVKQLHRQRAGRLGPLTGERDVAANWTMKVVNDPDRLTLMRLLYTWTLGRMTPDEVLSYNDKLLAYSIDMAKLNQIERGWFQCGRWRDVPSNACYVLPYEGTWYWVEPGREEEVRNLCCAVLDVATVVPKVMTVVLTPSNTPGVPDSKTTRTLPDNKKTLQSVQALMPRVTKPAATGAPAESARAFAPSAFGPPGTQEGATSRINTTPDISPGLLFAPR